MARLMMGVLLTAMLTPLAHAQRVPVKVPPGATSEAAQEYRALLSEVGKQRLAYSRALREAKTAEERQKALRENYPRPEKFSGQFLALAKKHADDPIALQALVWVATNVRTGKDPAAAIDILTKDYIEDKAMITVCQRLMRSMSPASRRLLEQVLEKSPHREAKGQACFGLMMQMKYAARSNPDSVKELEKYANRVIAEFADVKYYRGTIGDAAKRELYEIRNLGIGKTAPEITGEDIDGVKFKLTDYRGKVVVIDFWGNW